MTDGAAISATFPVTIGVGRCSFLTAIHLRLPYILLIQPWFASDTFRPPPTASIALARI
jgi:hypothetical protein